MGNRILHKICLQLLSFLYTAHAANILAIYIMPTYSHQMPLLRLSKALATRGHNLTVITTDPSEVAVANHTEIDMSFVHQLFKSGSLGATAQTKISLSDILHAGNTMIATLAQVHLKSPQITNFMSWAKDMRFEVVLLEQILVTPYLAMTHAVLGSPPVIAVSTLENSFWADMSMGCATNPAYIPGFLPYTDHMTFFQRIENLYYYCLYLYKIHMFLFPKHDQLIKEVFGEGMPSAQQLELNKTLQIYSGNGLLSYPKPVTPNIVHIGPLHIVPPKPLPENLQRWVEGAKDGVIYLSLGSNMQSTSLPEHVRNSFLTAFALLPNHRVIWKWESDTNLPGQGENVLFKKWIPQQDLLAHGKVKVFISQCGLQSTQEAIHYGVNIICMPLYGDQNQISRKVVDLQIGAELDFYSLTKESIYEKLKEILYNQKYNENIKELSAVSKDGIMSPVNQGIWWVEYVLRHKGAKHLRPASLDLHWTQFLMLDVVAFIISAVCVIVFIVYKIIKITLSVLLSRFTVKQKIQ